MRKNQTQTDAYGRSTGTSVTDVDEVQANRRLRKSSYEEFFSGYQTYTVANSNGRGTKVVREYKGTLYHQDMSSKQAVYLRIVYVLLFAFVAAIFFLAIALNLASNRCWYVMVVAAIAAVMLGRILLSLHTYVWSGRDLKEYEYRHGAVVLPERSKQAIYAILFLIAVTLVMFFVEADSFKLMELIRLTMLIFSCVLLGILWRIEIKIHYIEKNQKQSKMKPHDEVK